MNTKLLTSMGCLLLLAAAIAPSVLGHSENNYTYNDETQDGVTGAYYGAAGAATADETDYPNTIAAGAILCDIEVAGDGTTPNAQDEVTVDGVAGGGVPDTNDDGGTGGACHVRTYGYTDDPNTIAKEGYNTPGCPAGIAHAINIADITAGAIVTDTFIGASCDWKFSTGGTGATTTFQLCVINNAIQGRIINVDDFPAIPGSIGDDDIPGCVLTWIACMGDSTGGCTIGGTEGCGSDGSSDGINFGHGSTGVPYPTFYGAGWPGGNAYVHQGEAAYDIDADQNGVNEAPCPAATSTAQVFVFDAVNTNHFEIAGGSPAVHPALSGQIWQDGDVPPIIPHPIPTNVPLCAQEYKNGVYTTWPCSDEICGLPAGGVSIYAEGPVAGIAPIGRLTCTGSGDFIDTDSGFFGASGQWADTEIDSITPGSPPTCTIQALNAATYAFVSCFKAP